MTFRHHWFTQAVAAAISPYSGWSCGEPEEVNAPDVDEGSGLYDLDYDYVNDYDLAGLSGTITLRYGDVCFEHH